MDEFDILCGPYDRIPQEIRLNLERFRHEYICGRWGWQECRPDGRENDKYDYLESTCHVVILRRGTNQVLGYARITQGKFNDLMIGNDFRSFLGSAEEEFRKLLEQEGGSCVEVSRFLVDLDDPQAHQIADTLFSTIGGWCLDKAKRFVIMVTIRAMIMNLRRKGGVFRLQQACRKWRVAALDLHASLEKQLPVVAGGARINGPLQSQFEQVI